MNDIPREKIEILIWPDDSWMYADEYNERDYGWKGGDFVRASIDDGIDPDTLFK